MELEHATHVPMKSGTSAGFTLLKLLKIVHIHSPYENTEAGLLVDLVSPG